MTLNEDKLLEEQERRFFEASYQSIDNPILKAWVDEQIAKEKLEVSESNQ